MAKKQYVAPEMEIVEVDANDGNRYSLPYGIAKGLGLDTTGMRPREVWEMLKGRGITPENEYDKLKENAEKELPKEEPKQASVQKELAIGSDRMQYSKTLTQDRVKKMWEAGTPEMQDTTCRLFNEDSFGIGKAPTSRKTAFYWGYNKVGYMEGEDGGENSSYPKGSVWYHEIWHAIDCNYRQFTQQELEEKTKAVQAAIPMWSHEKCQSVAIKRLSENYLSDTYKLSTGKTLYETLVEEVKAKLNVPEIVKTHAQEVDEYYKAKGYDRPAILAKYDEIQKNAQYVYDEVWNKTKSYTSANQARDEYRNSEEYQKTKADWLKVQNAHPAEVTRKWGDLSDVISGATMDRVNLGMHHERKYWKESKYKRAHEFFAECASSKATSKESYALLSKYLPDSVKGFEELYSKLQKGEIKSNGREKWQP